jgi:hypothetical protein
MRNADPPKPALSAAASLTKSPAHPKIKVSRTHVRLPAVNRRVDRWWSPS